MTQIITYSNQLFSFFCMEELYTFNSRQLQLIKNNQNQQSSGKYRKKILSCNKSAKVSPTTKLSPLIQKQNLKFASRRKSHKKVQFAIPIEKIIDNRLLIKNQTKLQDTKSFTLHKNREDYQIQPRVDKDTKEEGYHIRPIKALIKRVFSAASRVQNQQKIVPLNEIKQIQNQGAERKQKKSISTKLSPKINFPNSNRKLPSAFKCKFGEKYLERMIIIQARQHIPKIPLVCRNEMCFDQSRETISQQIQKFKKLLMVESKFLQKLNRPA